MLPPPSMLWSCSSSLLLLLLLTTAEFPCDSHGFMFRTTSSILSQQQQQQRRQQSFIPHFSHSQSRANINNQQQQGRRPSLLYAAGSASSSAATSDQPQSSTSIVPQVVSTGCSQKAQLVDAVQEATERSLLGLPTTPSSSQSSSSNSIVVDVALVMVSSLYDGQPWSTVVPTIYQTCHDTKWQLHHVLGCTTAGVIGSTSSSSTKSMLEDTLRPSTNPNNILPVEWEGLLGVSVTLMQLPDTQLQIFHVLGEDVPDDVAHVTAETWKRAIGISLPDDEDSVVCLFPAPSFQTHLDDFISGFSSFGKCTLMGAIASTVSSLSRARLFAYASRSGSSSLLPSSLKSSTTTFTEGCVGLILQGDVKVRTLMAQGAKPVGGIYRIVKGQDSTIQVIVLDQDATQQLLPAELDDDDDDNVIAGDDAALNIPKDDDDDDDEDAMDDDDDDKAAKAEKKRRIMAEAYAKAVIPKPVLAEANFVMRALSDDEQAFMRKAILIGLERPRPSISSIGATAIDNNDNDDNNNNNSKASSTPLGRLAQGLGHGYTVHQVASAGMKDGSVTFALGSVTVQPGARVRFFVRERTFAKKEIQALWMGYKKRILSEQFSTTTTTTTTASTTTTTTTTTAASSSTTNPTTESSFTPTGCLVFPTLDRGTKFFLGKPGYESRQVVQFVPTIPSISGFFCNSVIGTLDDTNPFTSSQQSQPLQQRIPNDSFLHGSASGYFLIGSKSKRPIYSPALAAAERQKALEEQALAKAKQDEEDERRERQAAAKAKGVTNVVTNVVDGQTRAVPRHENGELILKRREVHAGRAISVSTVEWSVADKTAMPTSTLEGYMWDKETEVDRFRERVPLANLVSQCRLSSADPTKPKPRDFVGPILQAAARQQPKGQQRFVIIPECKRKEPTTGSIRKRYDVAKLVKQFTLDGAPAISVNCDAVLFGGSQEDITTAREVAASAAVSMMMVGEDNDGVVVPPILASDLVLYPYQLYKLRLAGADAVTLLAGALANKDLLYLTKIATSLQLQCLVSVTSEAQIRSLSTLPPGSVNAVIVSNRELEDFSFDMTGQQALDLLKSDALAEFLNKQTRPVPILVEGRVGLIQRPDDQGTTTALQYMKELQAAGAIGAIIGEGTAAQEDASSSTLQSSSSSLTDDESLQKKAS